MMCCQCWVTLPQQDKTGIAADAAVDAVVILLDGRAAAASATKGLSGASYARALDTELGAIRNELLKNPGMVQGDGL